MLCIVAGTTTLDREWCSACSLENCTNGNERKKNSKRIPVNRKCVKNYQQVVADKW